MPSNFDAIFETCAANSLDQHFGVQVTLTRSGVTSAAFTATFSSREYDVVDDGGVSQAVTSRDYTIAATNYLVSGLPVTPRAGDVLAEVENGVRFEVMPLGRKPCCELLSGNYRWLVHTKQISS